MLLMHRTALRRRICLPRDVLALHFRSYHPTKCCKKDPRLENIDPVLEDEFAVLKSEYQVPKHPIILAHGLLGFDELHLAGHLLPGVQYWRGITEALAAKGQEVIIAEVPPSSRIEVRAARLAESIERKAKGKAVNIIAYVLSANVDPSKLTVS